MTRTVVIDGAERTMRASALIPRLYRAAFRRDMVVDMNRLRKAYNKAMTLPEDATEEEKAEAMMTAADLEIFENVAWLMLRHAGEDIPGTPDEWLDSIDGVFSVYEVLPEILALWGANEETTSKPVKK